MQYLAFGLYSSISHALTCSNSLDRDLCQESAILHYVDFHARWKGVSGIPLTYNIKAARPATMALILTIVAAVPPVKGEGTGLDPVTVPLPLGAVLLEPVLLPLVRVKLAQVKRVVLLV